MNEIDTINFCKCGLHRDHSIHHGQDMKPGDNPQSTWKAHEFVSLADAKREYELRKLIAKATELRDSLNAFLETEGA